jgi:hypothetical protein
MEEEEEERGQFSVVTPSLDYGGPTTWRRGGEGAVLVW